MSTKKRGTYPRRHPLKRRKRRRIRKEAVLLLAGIAVLIVFLFRIPTIRTNQKLKALGYNKDEIKLIRKEELTKPILAGSYYSEYLAQEIERENVNVKYLSLYAACQPDRNLSEDDFLLYQRLLDKGYEEDQLLNLFSQLTFEQMTPLLVYDYQYDESTYINDCLNNTLNGVYYEKYKHVKAAENVDSTSVLINPSTYLEADYVPQNLVTIADKYALADQQIVKTAADALTDWCEDAIANGYRFYVTGAYVPYAYQDSAYQQYAALNGDDLADLYVIRAGYSEHQSGLAVDLVESGNEGAEFLTTESGKWALENAANYGFILRYPEGKEAITGHESEPMHFRYLGRELAQAVVSSGLTYDEYYDLYLKSWDDPANKPDQS